MLKIATALALVLAATPAFAQVTHQTTTTTTIQAPAVQPVPAPAEVTVNPLPSQPDSGPGDAPHNLGVLEDKIVHPGTVTTSGSSTTVTIPGQHIGTSTAREKTEFGIDTP